MLRRIGAGGGTRAAAVWLSLLAVAAVLIALSGSDNPIIAADKPDCITRPAWCEPGFICLPTACAAESAAQLDLLLADVTALKKKRARHWTCAIGPGAGVYLQVDKGQATFDAAPLAGAIVCGWAL